MKPFQEIEMNLLFQFPLSAARNRWITVAPNYKIRYEEAKVLPCIVHLHGAPEVIIYTGRGFTRRLM